jgi:hypothetical protein
MALFIKKSINLFNDFFLSILEILSSNEEKTW